MMTLVVMITAVRHRAAVRVPLLVIGTMLIAATVYLRYHYVVDLLAGVLFMAACLLTARPLHRFLDRIPASADRA
jgi:membrane-associated phospholipid phosphatase